MEPNGGPNHLKAKFQNERVDYLFQMTTNPRRAGVGDSEGLERARSRAETQLQRRQAAGADIGAWLFFSQPDSRLSAPCLFLPSFLLILFAARSSFSAR